MLHVILIILKIIGLILLAIIGLLLLIILIVLLVPIRYEVEAEHGEEVLRVNVGASWLWHALRARVTHLEGILHIRIKILWITVYDSLNPKPPKEKVNKTKSLKKKDAKRSQNKEFKANKEADTNKTVKITKTEQSGNNIVGNKSNVKDDNKSNVKDDKSSLLIKKEDASKVINKIEPKDMEDGTKTIIKEVPFKQLVQPELITQTGAEQKGKKVEEGETFFEKLANKFKSLVYKVKSLKERIINFFIVLKGKIKDWFTSISNMRHKYILITDFIQNERNRQGFKITYASFKKLIKHILPRKLKSRIVFGTGDPCSTGQALGVFGIIYSFYGDNVQVIPDFENKVLEGKHYARGRIRLVTLLIIVIKLILDKRFKQLKDNFLVLKEAL